MVRALDKADAMLTHSSALYNIGSHYHFNLSALGIFCVIMHVTQTLVIGNIRHSPYTRYIINAEVRAVPCCSPLSQMVMDRRLWFFGYAACCSLCKDHHRFMAASIQRPPANWRRPPGRPSHSQLAQSGQGWPKTSEFLSCHHCLEEDN